jgi:hypothetical protein
VVERARRPLVSILVLGASLLLFVSLAIPYFDPPFGGADYFFWLPILTIVLGIAAALRRERGPLARAGLIGSVCAGSVVVIPRLLVLIGGAILGLFGMD